MKDQLRVKMRTTTFEIPVSLLRDLKVAAAENGTTLRQILTDGAIEYLRRHPLPPLD